MAEKLTRRRYMLTAVSALGASAKAFAGTVGGKKPALLGGKPVRSQPFPTWPVFDSSEEKALNTVLWSGRWFRGRGKQVDRFEAAYAKLIGTKHCLATANGTSALFTSLSALGVGPGDEVILPPYTFVACVNVILLCHAVPVFVDTDRETFQIDAGKIEAAITDRTRAIMPVHLGGNTFDVDAVLAIARKHKLAVVEDSCQAHMAEWKGRRTGSFGTTGCFSFQASKNLNSGEGGALLTDDDELAERAYTFHNNSRGKVRHSYDFSYSYRGTNVRMTEFQAALLMAQMKRLEAQTGRRSENGAYLTSLLREIPGIAPAREYEGCTRNAYHLYMFRYDKDRFAGLPRAKFLKALAAEGVPASKGYSPLNKEPFIKETLQSRGYRVIYPERELAEWEERTACPENDRLCTEAVWLTQNMLLGPRSDMDQIAEAIRKIQAHAAELVKA